VHSFFKPSLVDIVREDIKSKVREKMQYQPTKGLDEIISSQNQIEMQQSFPYPNQQTLD
jgi:hypothetical protein